MSKIQKKVTDIKQIVKTDNFFSFFKNNRRVLSSATIFLIVLAGFIFGYNFAYGQKFFAGVTVNGESLSVFNKAITEQDIKLNPQERAINDWQTKIDEFGKTGLAFSLNNRSTNIKLNSGAVENNGWYNWLDYKVPETIDKAYSYGQTGNFFAQTGQRLRALLFGVDFPLAPRIEKEEFLKTLKTELAPFITEAKDAKPFIDADLNVTIASEEAGENFDYDAIFQEMKNRLSALAIEPIKIVSQPAEALIRKSEISDLLINKIKDFLNSGEIKFSFAKDSWKAKPEVFKDWLIFTKNEPGEIGLSFSRDDLKNYLLVSGADKINRPAINAKLSIVDGKVKEFQGNQDGQEIDWEQTFANINQEIFLNNKRNVELTVKITKATSNVGSLNDLGIREIIGVGHSNFAGSPQNRRHNIATGAAALNGSLIKPGETFSVIKALGEINGETGYLQELVIKGDRTIPEYGGGLCQIGTTVFRGVLNSGLPVTERRNHSYRVAYYEFNGKAGKDATIYSPKPDLQFVNDTGNYILIQSRIVKDDLYFDFWGTKDGRQSFESELVNYNIKPAGSTVIIETTDLKPGETQWLEKTSHAGADAYFDYKVTYPTGEVKEQRFSSHYIPWPAKMLVGKAVEATPTSTPEVLPLTDTVSTTTTPVQ